MAKANDAAPTESLMDAQALAVKLDVHPTTIRKWQTNGKIPAPVRIGASVRWRLVEIDGWIMAGCPPLSKWKAMRNPPATKPRKRA